jgi:hypothetical protein
MQAADYLAVEGHVQNVCKALAARLFAAGPGCQLRGQEVNHKVLVLTAGCWFLQLLDDLSLLECILWRVLSPLALSCFSKKNWNPNNAG